MVVHLQDTEGKNAGHCNLELPIQLNFPYHGNWKQGEEYIGQDGHACKDARQQDARRQGLGVSYSS